MLAAGGQYAACLLFALWGGERPSWFTCPLQLAILLLACSPTSATPHGRQLQTTVSDVPGLTTALADPSIGHISLSAGTYSLTSQLSIGRDVTLEAAQPGTVVLDGQGSTQVLYISSGIVELIALSITRGVALSVSAPASRTFPPSPQWRKLP